MNNQRDLILTVDGKDFTGWEEVSITRAIDTAASTFSLRVSDPSDSLRSQLGLIPGTAITLSYGSNLLVTGLIDTISVDYSSDSHYLTIDGRSKTKDLIDCSALRGGQIGGQTALQIAKVLASDYSIDVIGPSGLDKIPQFQIEQSGETVFNAIQRLADISDLAISDTPDGKLLLARIGSVISKNTLVKSKEVNTGILSCTFKISETDRFSEIQVKAQERGTDTKFGKSIAGILGSSTDEEIKRTRIKIVRADTEMDTITATKHARWLQQSAKGKATEIMYTVQDWTGNKDELWRENTLVSVTDNLLGIDSKLLVIGAVTYSIGSQGTLCVLTINPSDAFEKDTTEIKVSGPHHNKSKAKSKKKVGASTTILWHEGMEIPK